LFQLQVTTALALTAMLQMVLTDNGGLDWDKNGNDCYLLGAPVQVTYACEIVTTVGDYRL
jgi:hypothetical protein